MVTAEGKGLTYCCQGLCCLSHTASASKYLLPLGLRESLCREGYPVNLAGQKQTSRREHVLGPYWSLRTFGRCLEGAICCYELWLCIGHGYEVLWAMQWGFLLEWFSACSIPSPVEIPEISCGEHRAGLTAMELREPRVLGRVPEQAEGGLKQVC